VIPSRRSDQPAAAIPAQTPASVRRSMERDQTRLLFPVSVRRRTANRIGRWARLIRVSSGSCFFSKIYDLNRENYKIY
jgi:hypothetical protein